MPNNVIFLANRSHAYLCLSKYQDALADAQKAIKMDPSYWKGWSRLGLTFQHLGKLYDAKTALEQAVQRHKGTEDVEPTKKALADVMCLIEIGNYRKRMIPNSVAESTSDEYLGRQIIALHRQIAIRNKGSLSIGSLSLGGRCKFFVLLVGRQGHYILDRDLGVVEIAHPAFGKSL